MVALRSERILTLAWICLALVIGGCAYGDFLAAAPEEQFPDPSEPAYPIEILRARTERTRAVERWQSSLDALSRMIEFRRGARVSRNPSGKIVGISEDTDLQRWRLEMEAELLRARGALFRLERKVKADFQGEFPPWWPCDDG